MILQKALFHVVFLVLFSRARGEYEDEIQSVFKNNATRNDFANLLQSLIKLNEQRVTVLQKLYKLEDYGVLSEVLRSGNARTENENLKNLFLVVLSKNLSVPSRNLRRSMSEGKTDIENSLLKPDETSTTIKYPHVRHKSNSHQGKHKHSAASTEKPKDPNQDKNNFEFVLGNLIYPKAKARFQIEDGRPRKKVSVDIFQENDRTTKYYQFSESQNRNKYTGNERSHENREPSENPTNYPHEIKDNSKAEDDGNVNLSVQERFGMEDDVPKRIRLSHERFEKNHKHMDLGLTEEIHDQEPSHEHPIIDLDLNSSDGDDDDSDPKLNIDIFDDGKSPSRSDSDTPEDKYPIPHADLEEHPRPEIQPMESRKNLQKCIGKKATKICGKSCINAYKNVCRRLKCTSRSKRALKKECKRSCKKAFATSKYSDDYD